MAEVGKHGDTTADVSCKHEASEENQTAAPTAIEEEVSTHSTESEAKPECSSKDIGTQQNITVESSTSSTPCESVCESASLIESAVAQVHQLVTRRQLLPHETEQLLQLIQEDALLVCARGLCVERVVAALLHVHSIPNALLLVLTATTAETDSLIRLMQTLRDLDTDSAVVHCPIRVLTATETPPPERQRLYRSGGVLFVTPRILLLDLLTDRCPAHLVTGVIIQRAHVVVDSAQEAFILRLFRQKSKSGFIKAVSSNAVAFTAGFSHVERVMRSLFVRRLLLWPRFHSQIRDSLSATATPDVVELHVQLTPRMSAIHIALLTLINITVREFRRVNAALDCSELSVECVLSSGFNRVVRARIDPAWHQLSSYSHQLITDMRTLRALLTALLHQDCCSFYGQVAALQSQEASLSSSWSLMDEAETVFIEARCRVFGSEKLPGARNAKSDRGQTRELKFEIPPKCSVLLEVLDEIKTDISNNSQTEQSSAITVLILARESSTCSFLKRLIRDGCQATLWHHYLGCLAEKFGGSECYSPSPDDRRCDIEKSANKATAADVNDEDDTETLAELQWTSVIRLLFAPLKRPDLPYLLRESLEKHKPRYVLLYEMDVAAIRTLEVYQAWLPQHPLRVYTFLFSGTVEEQSYLTELRTEKEAFEYLIRQKEQMVVPEERDALQDHYEFDDLAPASEEVDEAEKKRASSRRGGVSEAEKGGGKERPRVIVDTREFRSELPSLLHRRGLHIVPATIEVGDYIITPDVCVERKSISDLVSSLISGRLHTQTENMVRHYRIPVLLIEFDQHKPFNLQRGLYVSSDVSGQQLMSRLQLLTLHFPQLRLMWCPSPLASAQLLHQLKQNAAEPSLEQARAITTDADSTFLEERFHPQIRNFVSKLPGVNAKNLFVILNRINTLADLPKLSKAELCSLMSAQDGERLYEALHRRLKPEGSEVTSAGKRSAPNSRNKQRSTRPRFWKSGK